MHGSSEVASVGSMWLAAILFVITYGVVMSEKVNRAVVALVAAGLMIILGILNQEAAIRGIDFNTIGLLIGMMVIVAITRQSGVFQFLASPVSFSFWRFGRPKRSMPALGVSWS